jgi:hypothetical protein
LPKNKALPEGIAHQRTFYLIQVNFFGLQIVYEQTQDYGIVSKTIAKIDFDTFGINAFEELSHLGIAKRFSGKHKSEGIHSVVQRRQSFFVGCFRFIYHNFLIYQPAVIGFVASHKREFSGKSLFDLDLAKILFSIEGLYLEAFVGFPNESFLEISPF